MHKYSLYFQYSNLKSQQNKIWDSTFIKILLLHLVSFRYFNASISINIQQAISTFLRIKPESSLFISPKPWFKTINVGIDFRSRIFVRDTLVLFTSISSNGLYLKCTELHRIAPSSRTSFYYSYIVTLPKYYSI